jgi:hypothetical protein
VRQLSPQVFCQDNLHSVGFCNNNLHAGLFDFVFNRLIDGWLHARSSRRLLLSTIGRSLGKMVERKRFPELHINFRRNLLSSMLYKVSDSPSTTERTLRVALRNSPFGEHAMKSLQRAYTIIMLHVSGVSSIRFQRSLEAIVEQKILDLNEII